MVRPDNACLAGRLTEIMVATAEDYGGAFS